MLHLRGLNMNKDHVDISSCLLIFSYKYAKCTFITSIQNYLKLLINHPNQISYFSISKNTNFNLCNYNHVQVGYHCLTKVHFSAPVC